MRPATTPARLGWTLVSLVVLSLLWGAIAAWTVAQRAAAAQQAVTSIEPLSVDAQQIYRALSDADATAATSFLSGGLEPLLVRHRYLTDIARAASRLARRTHRVLNRGLLAASVVWLVAAAWLFGALTAAHVSLLDARDHGSGPVEALARADIAALRAHSDESLTLVDNDGDDPFQLDFLAVARQLGPAPGTLLTSAAMAARGSAAARPAAAAARLAPAWYAVHRRLRSLDDRGQHAAAVRLAVGSDPGGSGRLFGRLDADLAVAIGADQAAFRAAGRAGLDDLTGLVAGQVAAALLMAAGCALGLTARLAEYR